LSSVGSSERGVRKREEGETVRFLSFGRRVRPVTRAFVVGGYAASIGEYSKVSRFGTRVRRPASKWTS
jgi:hypothetical protein